MLRLFCILALIAMTTITPSRGDVLLWQVDSSSRVDGIAIQQFLVPYTVDDDNWNSVRVKVIDGASSTVLDVWYDNPDDPPSRWEDGTWGVELGDSGGGYWGVDWVQSHYAGIALSPDSSIQAELLRCNFVDDDPQILAVSEARTLQWMVENNHYYIEGDISPPDFSPYAFSNFTSPAIPEPSAALLFLVGSSVLLLRRSHFT